jgi:hypothetical protein
MMLLLPLPTWDHLVINAQDRLDDAADTYRKLGFQLTPRGYHSMGSANNLAIFGTDYLEIIGVPPSGRELQKALLESPIGLNGLVFGTDASLDVVAAAKAAGAALLPPREFVRPVELADGSREDASFRIVPLDGIDYGRVYFCHHFTRHLVWRNEWRHHPNGVLGIARAVIVSDVPDDAMRPYRTLFGSDLVRAIPNGLSLAVGLASLDIVTRAEAVAQFGAALPDALDRNTYMAAITFRTASLDRAKAALGDAAQTGARDTLVVPAAKAFGATLEFIA